jgi:4'-phosphopantetheinyl transferase
MWVRVTQGAKLRTAAPGFTKVARSIIRFFSITSAEVHVWLAFYGEIDDERLHAAYRAVLSDEEKEREQRFYFARDRRRFLVTRALVRTVLSRYVAIAPADWTFSTNAYGRPAITNAEAGDLSFNLSHTHSLIVLAVSRGRAVGVDVENVRDREVSIDIADRFFAPQEVEALGTVPPQKQQDRFFEYWTFKESYIKARGMGLSLPLDQFSFHYAGDRDVALAIDPELGDEAARWQFWQFRPTPEYLVALCAERDGERVPAVTVRRVVPMVTEQAVALELLRSSSELPATPRSFPEPVSNVGGMSVVE